LISERGDTIQNIEIELTLKLENPEILMKWLESNATFVKETQQHDLYFDPPGKTFMFIDKDRYKDAHEWFRLRISDKGNEICYKKWYRDDKDMSTYADEIETIAGDEKQVLEILRRLGFREICVVKKHRKSWAYGNFHFDCDDIEGLGFFVEVEFKGHLNNPSKGKEKIIQFLKQIGITNWKITKRGYVWMLWNPGKEWYE